MYPQTKVWKTHTPYYEIRNIHFYINTLGFNAVEFFNEKYRDPHYKEDETVENLPQGVGKYFFKFEKIMK